MYVLCVCMYVHGTLVSCPRPYFSGIESGYIAYIEFQRNSITSIRKASLMFHNHMKNVKTPVYVIIIIII